MTVLRGLMRRPRHGRSQARLERAHRQHHYVEGERPEPNAIVDCGWGRLLFANTFEDVETLVSEIHAEGPEQRVRAITQGWRLATHQYWMGRLYQPWELYRGCYH
mgnify:CR=1 FL=1